MTFSVKVNQWRFQMAPPTAPECLIVLDPPTMGVFSVFDCANKRRREEKVSISFSHSPSPLRSLLYQLYRLMADACPTLCLHHYHQMTQTSHTHIINIIMINIISIITPSLLFQTFLLGEEITTVESCIPTAIFKSILYFKANLSAKSSLQKSVFSHTEIRT